LSAVTRRFSGGAVGLLAKHLERTASASEFHSALGKEKKKRNCKKKKTQGFPIDFLLLVI
jgi:hypothetical protein